jgi:hypothetical protein
MDVVTAVMLRRDGRRPGSTQQCRGDPWPDLTTLIGYYTTVSLTLAAYDVPADAVGLKR